MKHDDFIKLVATQMGSTQNDARRAINATNEVVLRALAAGDDVTMPGYWRFVPKARAAREGRNPATGETVAIAASVSISLKVLKNAKERLNPTEE